MVKDNIADFITQVKNAGHVGKTEVLFPYSKIIWNVADILVKEGYLASLEKKGKKMKKFVEVGILFIDGRTPKIAGVKRISKLSCRVYEKAKNLRAIRRGFGRVILSTPKGLMTDATASKEKLGGEVLFRIW
jgi:small subunit ribosomal protein S8